MGRILKEEGQKAESRSQKKTTQRNWKSENGKWILYTHPRHLYRYQKTEVTKFDGCKSLKIKNGQMAKQNGLRAVERERVKEILEQNGEGTHPPPGNNAKA